MKSSMILNSVQKDISLKPYNTFGVDVLGKYFLETDNIKIVQKVLQDSLYNSYDKLVIGIGSNILFTKHFPGFILKWSKHAIQIIKEKQNTIWIEADAGLNWNTLVKYCVENNYGGIENLSYIPGTVGAAPVQNIGAYGAELKDVFVELKALDIISGEIVTLKKRNCNFGYRTSIFKTKFKYTYLILSITIKLTKKIVAKKVIYKDLINYFATKKQLSFTLKEIHEAIINIRKTKLPNYKQKGNAGSFFKNPIVTYEKLYKLQKIESTIPYVAVNKRQVKLSAGWLIQHCGWKGKKKKDVAVDSKNALVIINSTRRATGIDIKSFSELIQKDVKEKFNIHLTPEVNIL